MSIDFGTDIYEEPIVAKTFLSEDAQEGSMRPKTLREYIGQEKAKGNLAVFIEAARLPLAFSCPMYSRSVFGRSEPSCASSLRKVLATMGSS